MQRAQVGRWARAAALVAALAGAGGCSGYESEYERRVVDFEPLYCYRTLADVWCARTPSHRDRDSLVNFYGPGPGRYAPPPPPRLARPAAPPPASFDGGNDGDVGDEEPRPRTPGSPAAPHAGGSRAPRLDPAPLSRT